MNLSKLTNLHSNIAKDVWPNGVSLRCAKCGHSKNASKEEAAGFLRKGWPQCCNLTMGLESVKP